MKLPSDYKRIQTLTLNPKPSALQMDASDNQNPVGGRWLSLTPYYCFFWVNIDFDCDAGHRHTEHT